MSRSTLLHRDLSSRIESLKQIVETSKLPSASIRSNSRICRRPSAHAGDMYSIDLNPNTNQLILKCNQTNHPNVNTQSKSSSTATNSAHPPNSQLDEGFESDVDTISLVSTESTMSKSQETDSANGSASSDSDDCGETTKTFAHPEDNNKSPEKDEAQEEVTEYFNLVNCVCYTDDKHPDILILVANEETLVFRFEKQAELETFHSNFSTIKAVANQKTYMANNHMQNHFNLLQRTDSNGMTHIRISRSNEQAQSEMVNFDDNEDFTSIVSLPNLPSSTKSYPHVDYVSTTLGKPPRRRPIGVTSTLKKSKSIEDFLDDEEKPLRKTWTSAENLLDAKVSCHFAQVARPKAPPRRKKGPAPQPPAPKPLYVKNNLSKSFTNLHLNVHDKTLDLENNLGNVFQGQFVRVHVDHTSKMKYHFPIEPIYKMTPEILKYESLTENYKSNRHPQKVRNFDAFKFSDPKNVTGYAIMAEKQGRLEKLEKLEKCPKVKTSSFENFAIHLGFYKGLKSKNTKIPGNSQQDNGNSNFTNRLFGMSSKLKEFSPLQSGCNPNRRYETNPHGNSRSHCGNPIGNPNYLRIPNSYETKSASSTSKFSFGKLGRLGRSGSLGNLTLLANSEKLNNNYSNSSTLKSVIKKKGDDGDERNGHGNGRKLSRAHGKKVTFSAYNTVQVV